MRWDRLFADLEGAAADIAREDTELLAADLSDDWWGETSWRDLVGGRVTVDVRGVGHVAGTVGSVNATLMRLEADTYDVLVATSAVVEVIAAQRRADPPSRVEAALGWASALRRLREADEIIRVTLDDGRQVRGYVDAVGQDFVRVESEEGRRRIVVLDAIVQIMPDV